MSTTRDPSLPGGIPSGARFFEETFRNHESGWFFGSEPSTLARRLHHFTRLLDIPSGLRLLDLGCGEGRDLIFFAGLGFKVEGADGSPTAVQRARAAIDAARLDVKVIVADIADYPWDGSYDLIVANNSVQFVGAGAPGILDEIRGRTKPGGFNAIGMFTKEETDWRREAETYCLESRELRFLYRDWTLLEYGESVAFSPRRAHYLSFANLIARRPVHG